VAPERLARWVAGFAQRHGDPDTTVEPGGLTLRAPDGAVAVLMPPPGVLVGSSDVDTFAALAAQPYRVGLVLARRAAVAVGVAHGAELIVSKVDRSYVQGRTAAGGWSQHRFARRRENQARAAAAGAADLVARTLLGEAARLAALVTGGDRRAVAGVLADRRLAPLVRLRSDRFLDVAEPSLRALQDAVAAARAVHIRLTDPPPGHGAGTGNPFAEPGPRG
jgi:VLRF1 release factor-like protein